MLGHLAPFAPFCCANVVEKVFNFFGNDLLLFPLKSFHHPDGHFLRFRSRVATCDLMRFFVTLKLETSFWGSATPCFSPPPPRPSIFSDNSFGVHHLVNQDDWHLLAHAMASNFSSHMAASLKENNWNYKHF
jgi:hypothetical protein